MPYVVVRACACVRMCVRVCAGCASVAKENGKMVGQKQIKEPFYKTHTVIADAVYVQDTASKVDSISS